MFCVATEICFPPARLVHLHLNLDVLSLQVLEFEVETSLQHLVASPARPLVYVIVVSESDAMLFYSITNCVRD